MKRAIDDQVRSLVGLPLCDASRAVDMATFGFGALVSRESRWKPGQIAQIPEFRLHIQCQWRIVRDGAIFVGYGDWHWPPTGSDVEYYDFMEADAPRNHRDDLVAAFTAHGETAHSVDRAEGATTGDLRLEFSDGCVLEIFPNYATRDDLHDEYWRLLPPDDGPHFVVSAHGVELRANAQRAD